MIKTIIFDFGDVFINLDKVGANQHALQLFGLDEFPEELIAINTLYEQGLIETEEFIDFYEDNFEGVTRQQIIDAWNIMIQDFPKYRLDFIKQLKAEGKYKLILLSNTNELHINFIKEHVSFYEEFKSCFDNFYLSHEINLRKPEATIFEFVLAENNLNPEECVFIDDTLENTTAAADLGFFTWNNDPKTQDVINLFELKTHLF
ncbi:HAD family hydrolase [Aurantibacter aestuarii]|uniref:Haloacid dehalogenase n=1 Tax=Aurantibacter aestuarii TaxID=1266046 RepID=A0A2T1N9C4_9FLAO|nr:HAD family phosphatase [Aurantibacter aestuarii]PSG88458.1 haloacid dehalogenase [Aurantibacter aestuarii]